MACGESRVATGGDGAAEIKQIVALLMRLFFVMLHSCLVCVGLTDRYFTPNGNATLNCGGKNLALDDVQQQFHNEVGSTFGPLPAPTEVLRWAQERVRGW